MSNISSIDAVSKLTPEVMTRIDEVLGNKPEQAANYKTWQRAPRF